MAKGRAEKEQYKHVHAVRLNEKQDKQLRKHSEASAATVNEVVRNALVEQGIIDAGAEGLARKGYTKRGDL